MAREKNLIHKIQMTDEKRLLTEVFNMNFKLSLLAVKDVNVSKGET